jgi:hypothetical protein
MGTYWDNDGPHQYEYQRLFEELVAPSGMSSTIEGECLSAASRLAHDYWNNGGGNNVSGAFFYLRQHLPLFKKEWTEALIPFVCGSGGIFCSNAQLCAVEEILDTTVQFVISRDCDFRPNSRSFLDMNIMETGYEISEFSAQYMREKLLENGDEPDVQPNYEKLEFGAYDYS